MACDRSTLLRSDPPYPGGTSNDKVPDPDILRLATNHKRLPGAGRQKKNLRTVTEKGRGEEERYQRVPGKESRDELGGVTGGESRNNRCGISTVESREAVHSVQGEDSEEDTDSTRPTNGGRHETQQRARRQNT
ncbi:hypothetical protein NDU88_009726 [Pleurodeles waltl]|uniref:Uncharacterized protein n=1 Tax=Pleurodeles waltl TaxID=8319 RepID=A0AAV7PWT6_PLEWA|nr:hypothetical protein NDU88_009726 [Pleurodeles waltl]